MCKKYTDSDKTIIVYSVENTGYPVISKFVNPDYNYTILNEYQFLQKYFLEVKEKEIVNDEKVKIYMDKYISYLKDNKIDYKPLKREYVLAQKHQPSLKTEEKEEEKKGRRSTSPRKLGKKWKYIEMESKIKKKILN